MIRLKGSLQHYDWGGYEFISNLIRRSVPEDKPLAELWLGTHPRGPALTEGGTPLPDLLTEKPRRFLGHRQSDGQLPFLFKVLDVRQMLSIQVHPGKSEAEAGFEREDKLGIPIGAPHRNFKDRNHKPELMVALSPFWLLHGFREEKEIIALLSDITGSQRLIRTLEEEGLKKAFQLLMNWPQAKVDSLLATLDAKLRPVLEAGRLDPDEVDYWVATAFRDFCMNQPPYDRGILTIYMLNLVKLQPDQAIFQDAGIPHAYLRGQNVEIMANSDNVFRCGLTSKHVDPEMLLAHTRFTPVQPRIIEAEPVSGGEYRYPSPAGDFELRKVELEKGGEYRSAGRPVPEILLVYEGKIQVGDLALEKGESVFIEAGEAYRISAASGGLIFKATLPAKESA